jgi:hypothetical protein
LGEGEKIVSLSVPVRLALAKMGFFKTPRVMKKKKAETLIDIETFVSPGGGTAVKKVQSSKREHPSSLSLAPPLFHTVTDTDHKLLKNIKGTAGSRCCSVQSTSGSPRSGVTGNSQRRVSIDDSTFGSSDSAVTRTAEEVKQRLISNYNVSPSGCNETRFAVCKPLPATLPLASVDKDSDSAGSLVDIGSDEHAPTSAPQSPADSTGSLCNRSSSFRLPKPPRRYSSSRSLKSPQQPQEPSPFRSTLSPKQSQKIPSFRSTNSQNHLQRTPSLPSMTSPKQPKKLPSSRSPASLENTYSVRSVRSDDESCSYIEEYILDDDDEYYEEEIIEDEMEVSMLDSDEILLFQERKTSVRFEEFDEMQLTLHLNDYTDHELKRTWYKRKDYDEMISEARRVALKDEERRKQIQTEHGVPGVSSSHFSHKSELEARGLEAWSPSGARQVRSIKEAAIEAVWDEQHRQWETGSRDCEQIRQEYQKVTVPSQKEAEERGLVDQKVVEKIRQLEELSMLDKGKKKQRRAGRILMNGTTFWGKSVKAVGKVARESGKRNALASVGGMTFDPKILLEAIKNEKKKRESNKIKQEKRPTYKQLSMSAREVWLEASLTNLSTGNQHVEVSSSKSSIRDKGAVIAPLIKARADKLKILRVLPVAGITKKDDGHWSEKTRKNKRSGFATWEVGLAAGGKL